jgi:outer membrane lipoprotein-sorting protein
MRRIVGLAVAVVLGMSVAARADDQADLKKLIEKAIKAVGGEEHLAKFNGVTFKGKGKFYGMGEGIDYTGEWAIQQPDKLRFQFDSGGNFTLIRVVNGDKIWMKIAGQEAMLVDDKDEIAEAREVAYAGWVATLLPLVKERGFTFAPLGEVKVDDKPAVGVRVSQKGHRDVNLFFDKDKGWLVKSETVVKDLMGGGGEMTQEAIYSDFKEVNGTQRSMKIVINRNGKKYVEADISEIEAKDKIDDSVFAKP